MEGIKVNNANLSEIRLNQCQVTDIIVSANSRNEIQNLRGIDASGLELHGCDFTKVDFRNANLKNACLMGKDLTGTNFIGANMRGLKLERTNISKAFYRQDEFAQANLFIATRVKLTMNLM